MLYSECFDREGDDAGISDWTNGRNSGMMDKTQVFWGQIHRNLQIWYKVIIYNKRE